MMRILISGASSFTGYWFVKALADVGHEVTASFTRDSAEAYADEPVRGRRVAEVVDCCHPEFSCRFGDAAFVKLIERTRPDVVCQHAADVTDYKSPNFDVPRAVANNTHNLTDVLATMQQAGCGRLLLTGSVFEGGEGAGSEGLPHFSPYGLSKALTAEMFRYYCRQAGVHLGKFVIPNPFGPLEEPRFTAYLMRTWFAGDAASVKTPAYVRDNIHVELLARAYARFVDQLPTGAGFSKLSPSGYVESQGAFAERFASAMRQRLGIACELELLAQHEFPEPRIRLGTEPVAERLPDWSEPSAWDAIAEFYQQQLATVG